MNGISSNITASAILKNTQAQNIKATSSELSAETADAFEKSSPAKDFKKPDFLKLDEKAKDWAIKGAAIGGVAGGIAGGIVAYNMSMNTIKATNDFNTITLDWQEPVMQKEVLGEIPSDFYSSSRYSNWISYGHGTTDVTRDNPVMQNGKPVMQNVSKEYANYGTPEVSWNTNNIEQKKLNGYSESIREDIETYQVYEGKDEDGNDVYSTHERVVGYDHDFYPDIERIKVGEFQTPKVRFETGVNITLNTALGVLAGAGIGALAGGIAGAAIAKATS